MFEVSGIMGVLVLVADIWAIVKIAQSGSSTGGKAIWIAIIILLPVLGLVIWFFAGPKGG